MKKNFLAVIIIISATASSVFGWQGFGDGWVDLLVTRPQFKITANQLGFLFGSSNFVGVVGFNSQGPNTKGNTVLGKILAATTGAASWDEITFMPTATVGFGYKSAPFGIGVGYSYTYITPFLMAHTPALSLAFWDSKIRLGLPITIVKADKDGNGREDYFGISSDGMLKIDTGIDAFNHIRLYPDIGYTSYKIGNDQYSLGTLGLEFRFYFLKHDLNTVNVSPYIRVIYKQAFGVNGRIAEAGKEGSLNYSFLQAFNAGQGLRDAKEGENSIHDREPLEFRVGPSIGLTVNSDIVQFYIEPTFGYKLNASSIKAEGYKHDLFWELYSETYIRPTQDILIYIEAYIGNGNYVGQPGLNLPFTLNSNLGINWFIPWLNIGS